MKTSKIIIALVAATIASAASFAALGSKQSVTQRLQPQEIAILMFGSNDVNNDGVLDIVELADSIESLYELRNDAIRNQREALIENGFISEAESARGIITLSLLPEDAAAIMMKNGDTNENLVLEVDELIGTVDLFRKLNLGTRSLFATRS